MSTAATEMRSKLRDDIRITSLFANAESRHFTAEEFAQYSALAPQFKSREVAAREIMDAQLAVVSKTVRQIFSIYPYPRFHEHALEKAIRDIGYVSVYATHSMMMDDPDWFRDKLLIWLKTILQSFQYPARERVDNDYATTTPTLPHPEITAHADTLPKGRSSIYETYSRLIINFQEVLSPQTFNLLRPHLQLAVDILSSD